MLGVVFGIGLDDLSIGCLEIFAARRLDLLADFKSVAVYKTWYSYVRYGLIRYLDDRVSVMWAGTAAVKRRLAVDFCCCSIHNSSDSRTNNG